MVGTKKNGLTVLLVAVLFACLAALSFFVPTKGVSAADGTEGSPSDAVMTAEDLQSAISAAGIDDTVTLTGNVNGNITVGADADVIIDLNGFEMTSSTQGVPTVKNEGTLKIVDGSADKTGVITRENTATYYVVVNEGDLTLDGVTVRNDNAADTSSLLENNFDCAEESAATLTIESGTYYCAGGNVVKNENYGTLNINGGDFTSAAVDRGGSFSVLLVVGTANITGGTFTSTADGDGVRVVGTNGSTAALDITGGTFTVTASGAKALLLQNGDVDLDKGTLDVNIGGGTFNGDIGVVAQGFAVTATDEITISDGTFNGSVIPGITIKSEITGGIFSEIVDATYYPADFVLCVNDEGKYTVAQPDSIPSGWSKAIVTAEMTTEDIQFAFSTIQEALDKAVELLEGGVDPSIVDITLLDDIQENIIVPNLPWTTSTGSELVRQVKLYLNGHTLTAAEDGAVIVNNGKFTLENASGISGGGVARDSGTQGVVIENNGTISFNNRGFIIANNNTADESYLIENNGTLTFSSLVSRGANTYSAAGGNLLLNNEGGKATLSGGSFVGSISNLSAVDGSVAIKGGTYSEIPDYKYFANGYVWTKNESGTFDAVKSENGFVAVIGNIGYTSLADAVWSTDTGDVDATVITIIGEGNVVNGAGVVINGQNVIIDLNGKTYNVINPTVGSPGTETNGFQMLKGSKVVFRNGALTSDVAKILLQNYCDLTLENVTINATGSSSIQYIASNNNGSFTAVGNTQLIADEGQVAFDVYYNLGGSYPDGVTVTFGEDFTGKVTGKVEYGVSNAVDGWEEKTVLNISGGEFDITISPSGTTAQDANINISGGNFTQAFDGAYLASDAVLYPTADGAFAVADQATAEQETIGVAQIGQVIYEKLADAVAAAREGDTVKLLANVNASIVIAEGRDITIDLNGYTLTGADDHGIINNGTLVITDSVGGGKVVVTADSKAALLNYGDATLLGGEFTRETAGTGGWYVIKNYGSLVIGEENKECGVVVDSNGGDESSLLVSGYYDADDKAANEGLITSANPLKVVINGGTFNGGLNTIKNDSESVMTINGGTFTNGKNYTVQNCNEMTVNGGTFVQTASKDVNGRKAVYALYSDDNTKLTITAGDFTAVTYAVYLKDNVNADISGGTFEGETALYAGGKVTLTISGGAFTGTEKYGISIGANAVVDISGEETVISGSEYGLRVSSAYGNINISDATISGETAVYMNRPTSYAITSGVFNGAINVTNNTAGISGGTFDSIPNYKYFTDGYVWTDNGDGTYGVEQSEETFVAVIDGIGYTSLLAAMEAAPEGATITLIDEVVIDTEVTLDLSGYVIVIDETFPSDTYDVAIKVIEGGALTITGDGVIDAQLAGDNVVPVAAMRANSSIIMNGGTIIVDTPSESCLFAMGGSITINGGTLKNLCEDEYSYGGGRTQVVNISNGTPGQLVINGGTFIGRNPALGDDNLGGTFIAEDAKLAQSTDESGNVVYVALGQDETVAGVDAVYYVENGLAVAEVYTAAWLADALAATTGADKNPAYDVIRLGDDISGNIVVDEGRTLTIDLNGYTLTGEGDHTIVNNGTLTVIDSSAAKSGAVDNVTHAKGALVNNGTATLNGGTFKRSAEAGVSATDNGGNSWYVIDNHGTLTINDGVAV